MNKKFDCVDMKHQGAEIIQAKIANLTLKEELAYWKAKSNKLRQRKRHLSQIQKVEA